ESEDGIELVEADFVGEGALLRKDSEEYWIYMNGEGGEPGVASVAANPGAEDKKAKPEPESRRLSYKERLRLRRKEAQERRRQEAEKNTLTGKDLEEHLQAYQMDVIRQGGVPLPIPLTPEMDDQLVAEGVLPPVEQDTSLLPVEGAE
ncbi:hypothetical protein ACFLSJ_05495, partial [Verrucomicrobiota bacterium]